MTRILVEIGPLMFHEPQDLDELTAAIADLDPEYEAKGVEAPPPSGGGFPYWDIISVYVQWEDVAGGAAEGASAAIVAAVLDWFRKKPPQLNPGGAQPPQRVFIYGPKGEVLDAVELDPDDPRAQPRRPPQEEIDGRTLKPDQLPKWPED